MTEDGIFQDIDDLYTWSMEGEKATVGSARPSKSDGTQAITGESSQRCWKPSFLPKQFTVY